MKTSISIPNKRLWTTAAVFFCALLHSAIAEWPLPDPIPNGSARLQVARTRLLAESERLLKLVRANDAGCKKVLKGSRKAEDCDKQGAVILVQIEAYQKAIDNFNAEAKTDHTAADAQHSSGDVARLQDRFQSLKQQIDIDQQVVRNFGFQRTVEEIEYWGHLPARQVEDAKNTFKAMLFDATLGSVSEAVGAVGSLTPEEVDALNRLADAQGAPSLGIVTGANDLHRAIEFLDKAKGAYEVADAVRKRQMLDAAVKLGGLTSKNPAFGLLLTADSWAAYQVYQSATAVKTVHDLTKVNEGDLILLKSRSEKLKNEVNELTGVKKQLARLSSERDSTKLVRKPK